MSDNAAPQIEIRKYPNRRFYDATRSRHLTLDQIRSLVQEGCDIRVTDSKTGVDITGKVLAQIIMELDEDKIEALPVALLQRLIRVNDEVIKEFLNQYFNKALAQYVEYRKQFESRFLPNTGLNPFWPFTIGPAQPVNKKSDADELLGQVARLQEQVERLEAKLGGAKKGNPRRERKGN